MRADGTTGTVHGENETGAGACLPTKDAGGLGWERQPAPSKGWLRQESRGRNRDSLRLIVLTLGQMDLQHAAMVTSVNVIGFDSTG